MPNYVSTALTVVGPRDQVEKFIKQAEPDAEKDRSCLTFEAFVPMPESLHVTEGSDGDFGYALYIEQSADLLSSYYAKQNNLKTLKAFQLWADIHLPEARRLGEAYAHNLKHHGHRSWYGWSMANWGTKWDACDASRAEVEDVKDDTVRVTYYFSTAWSPCEPVITAMSEQFPALTFTGVFDEESRAFYYEAVWENGEKLDEEELEREPDEGDAEVGDGDDVADSASPADAALADILRDDEPAQAAALTNEGARS